MPTPPGPRIAAVERVVAHRHGAEEGQEQLRHGLADKPNCLEPKLPRIDDDDGDGGGDDDGDDEDGGDGDYDDGNLR